MPNPATAQRHVSAPDSGMTVFASGDASQHDDATGVWAWGSAVG